MMPIALGHSYILENTNELDEYFINHDYWFMIELKPVMESTKYSWIHIKQSIMELNNFKAEMELYKHNIDQRIVSFEDDIRSHLWVTDEFVDPASEGLDKTRTDVEELLDRLEEVVKGFAALPREEDEISP